MILSNLNRANDIEWEGKISFSHLRHLMTNNKLVYSFDLTGKEPIKDILIDKARVEELKSSLLKGNKLNEITLAPNDTFVCGKDSVHCESYIIAKGYEEAMAILLSDIEGDADIRVLKCDIEELKKRII